MKENNLCRSKDIFRSTNKWLRRFFNRNKEIRAMTHSVRKAIHVPHWMLQFSDVWLFYYNRIIDPEQRDEAAIRLIRRIQVDNKMVMKSKKRIEEVESNRSDAS